MLSKDTSVLERSGDGVEVLRERMINRHRTH